MDCPYSHKCRRYAYSLYTRDHGADGYPPALWPLAVEYCLPDILQQRRKSIWTESMPQPDGTYWCPDMAGYGYESCHEYQKEKKQLDNLKAARERRAKYPDARRRVDIPQHIRYAIAKKWRYQCAYCGRNVNTIINGKRLGGCVDHLIPLAQGGHETDPDNLVFSCLDCNQQKSSHIWALGCRKPEGEL